MDTKKTKFIFWLIGLGCGMILSGIFMLVLVLQIQNPSETITGQGTYGTAQPKQEENEKLKKQDTETSPPKVLEQASGVKEVPNEPQKIKLKIPPNIDSTDISILLEKEGIVDRAKGFETYIANQNKSTKLRAGTWEFPRNGAYEDVLNILINGN
ncbi:MAG: hypothetical protein AB9856_19750 [Cellulosilyticaceae bacterium]